MFSLWKPRSRPAADAPRPEASKKRSQEVANEVAGLSGLPLVTQVPGRTVLGWNRAFGYDTSLTLMSLDAGIYVGAEARHLRISERKFPRKAFVWMLTANNQYRVGSTRFVQVQEQFTIVHGMVCDITRYDAATIAAIGRRLLVQYDEILTRLYALDYIPHGPLPARSIDQEGETHAG